MLFVFMSQPDFACNPYALYEYIRDNTEHETAWIIKKSERFTALRDRGVRCALYNTIAGNQLVNEADYVVMNSYTFMDIPKREGQVVVNLWHGSGVKAHDYYNYDLSPNQAKRLSDYFEKVDLMCVHSLDDRFRLSAMLHYDIRRSYVTGQPRLDCVKSADGKDNLKKLFSDKLDSYDRLILFTPSFRANMSSHSGTIFSDNIFRLEDYDDTNLKELLEEYNAALIYKLHPIEQTAFAGRVFELNEHCYELTDEMLFDDDLRYDELLNAFDVMISDYSSIVFDYLLLNRPIVYLLPDYEEYISERGFVFKNIDDYMPGEKAFNFAELLSALKNCFTDPLHYEKERMAVLRYRFDYTEGGAAERCYDTIMGFEAPKEVEESADNETEFKMPSSAQHIAKLLPNTNIIDSTREIPKEYSVDSLKKHMDQHYLYITEEIPDEFRRLTGMSANEICDIAYYYAVSNLSSVDILYVQGGVDYNFFSENSAITRQPERPRIGFAGIIDNRIYFAMVQCICEVFSDYDVVFAGEIYGKYPVWLDGFDNLHFIETSYEDLPSVIATFDVAILPMFGRHRRRIPNELYQYLACGKQVIASDMDILPQSPVIYSSKSVADSVANIKRALMHKEDEAYCEEAWRLAKEHDWSQLIKKYM